GDCVNVAAAQPQCDNADAANDILENPLTTGLTDGIPYGIAVGNHDQNRINQARSGADENVTTTLYNQTFPKSRFQGRGYFGGQYPLPGFADSMDNHYELFSAGGMDFIVFHLEWDDGNCSWPSNGSVPTGTLNTCQNVFLILGGHLDQANHRVDLASDGHPIYTVVSDFQSRPNGGNGWLRIMTFDPTADTIHIETYSPTIGAFINKPTAHADNAPSEPNGNELTLPYDMDA